MSETRGGRVVESRELTALILAGGEGARLGGEVKAFLETGGATLLERAVDQVARFAREIIVGLPGAHVGRGESLVGDRAVVVVGGETRQGTFEKTFSYAGGSYVLIHDVARPLASDDLFREVLTACRRSGAACPVLRVEERDSLALIDGNWLGEAVDRTRLGAIQTPYAFSRDLLTLALARAEEEGFDSSSVTTLVTRLGTRVEAVAGERGNVKITYPRDWELARRQLSGVDA